MPDIDRIHSNFFTKIFAEQPNAVTFLAFILPGEVKAQLDLSRIVFEQTTYISEEYRPSLSDLVVRCKTRQEKFPVDIYLLFEHKSFADKRVLLQLHRYMSLIWQQDYERRKAPRVVLPVVFYHGKKKWAIPTDFVEQFPVSEKLKPFLLNFRYFLFDANQWDWQAEESEPLRKNVYLLSAMLLMKAAFQKNVDIIRQVFRLWHQMGLIHETERIAFLMLYLVQTQDIPEKQLTKILQEESKIKGETIMPTLAERWVEQGKKLGKKEGRKEGRREGRREGYIEGKQDGLLVLLATRFQLTEAEKEDIKRVQDVDTLNQALQMALTAEDKQEIFAFLRRAVEK